MPLSRFLRVYYAYVFLLDFILGYAIYTAYFSPAKPGKWLWGIAPAVLIPTSTSSELGVGEWGLGASFVALTLNVTLYVFAARYAGRHFRAVTEGSAEAASR